MIICSIKFISFCGTAIEEILITGHLQIKLIQNGNSHDIN